MLRDFTFQLSCYIHLKNYSTLTFYWKFGSRLGKWALTFHLSLILFPYLQMLKFRYLLLCFMAFVVHFCIYGAKAIHMKYFGKHSRENLTTIGSIVLQLLFYPRLTLSFLMGPSSFYLIYSLEYFKFIWKLYCCLFLPPLKWMQKIFSRLEITVLSIHFHLK